MAWTKEQELAINAEGKNIIVSAGAGSGKTAVLTARVIRKLKSGVHINELLVLTFTNAAAAEMKDRIRSSINKTKGLENEANLIDSSYITTFDSFSLSMVKKYHTRLNITNKIEVSDEVIVEIEKKKILDEIFEEYYSKKDEKFLNLISDFCLKDDKDLKKSILNIYKKIELKYDKISYLNNYFNIIDDSKINDFINDFVSILKTKQTDLKDLYKNMEEYFDGDFMGLVNDSLGGLMSANTYDEFKKSTEFSSVRVPKGSDETGKKIKSELFSIAKDIKDSCIYDSTKEMKDEILSTKSNTEVIVNILKELDKRLDEYKYNNEVFTFTDISRMAIKVVEENEDIRRELRDSFNEILVDEYQDTSDTQEKFISLISNNNVYMVGDIKQSIYRFRNANPYIFKNKYDNYSNNQGGMKIDLLKNFRSRSEVLSNINTLFDLFMSDKYGGADYKKSHRMVYGNTLYDEVKNKTQDYNMNIITYNKELGNITKDEEEAFVIANDIQNKINNKYQVFDKNTSTLRDIEYSDFVILLDKSRNFTLYKKIFEYMHIPLTILKEENLSKDYDIVILKNLLRFIICIHESRFDNEFKYTFTSLSRSFLFKISDEEIYNYLVNGNYKETELYKVSYELSKDLDTISSTEFIRELLDKVDYEEKLLTTTNIKSYRVRCEYFYNLIRDYSSKGNTVYDFVDYLNEIEEDGYDLKFNINTDSSNSCKIMTIHKSKGLEFPICYFAGFSSKFNMKESKEKIIYDNKYGIILPKVDNYYKDTVLKTLVKYNMKMEEISEKIRLLYVAVTRAKENIVIVVPEQEESDYITNMVPNYIREKYSSFMSIIQSIYSNLTDYITKTNVVATKDYLNNNKGFNKLNRVEDNLVVNEINIKTNIVESTHFSKENLHLIEKREKEVMNFGTKVHEILEEIDFNNIDNIEIDNKFIKNKVKAFINSNLMKDKLNLNMYKEYEFIYNENNEVLHGIIDLLIEGEVMTIVDYKLKNIDDPAYDKQLNGYRKYIEEKTHKKTNCYLYSIMDEKYREVLK